MSRLKTREEASQRERLLSICRISGGGRWVKSPLAFPSQMLSRSTRTTQRDCPDYANTSKTNCLTFQTPKSTGQNVCSTTTTFHHLNSHHQTRSRRTYTWITVKAFVRSTWPNLGNTKSTEEFSDGAQRSLLLSLLSFTYATHWKLESISVSYLTW